MQTLKECFILCLILLLACCVPACKSVPNVPKTVEVVVETPKPLPTWVTVPLPLPPEADTVQQHLEREDALEANDKRYRCKLLAAERLSRGEAVPEGSCQ